MSQNKVKWAVVLIFCFAVAWIGTVIFVAQHFIRKYW